MVDGAHKLAANRSYKLSHALGKSGFLIGSGQVSFFRAHLLTYVLEASSRF